MASSSEENTVDFDLFWAGHSTKVAAPTIKVKGYVATLNVGLSFAEMQTLNNADITDADQVQVILVKLYGQEAYDHWFTNGLLFSQAPLLVLWGMFKLQGIDMPLSDVSKHMNAIAGKALTSFGSTGGRSKLDSNNTTELEKTRLGPLVRDGSTSF